jgi:chemotaxis protein methyltransferase CheR
MISDNDFHQLTSLIRERIGIHIPPGKKTLLAARLSERMRTLGLSSYADYHRHVLSDPAGELSRMTDAICTNETRFFRDSEQFSYIESAAIPAWIKGAPRRIRVWSAGCSTGEEAFSIAMLLLSKVPVERGFAIEVLGTDISGAALEKARAARWPSHRVQDVPDALRQRYLTSVPDSTELEASRELRNVVRFQKQNLWDWYYPVTGRFDLVFCRNVLIYFDADTRAGVVRRLVERLTPNGLLLLGMSESLLAVPAGGLGLEERAQPHTATPLRAVGPAIYARDKRYVPPRPSRPSLGGSSSAAKPRAPWER